MTPLITKPDGTKYGKTEGDALWLDPEMMSPYAFHQWWLNVDDSQVGELLRIFTFLSHEEIEALEARDRGEPWQRSGQKRLADEVTTFVHGVEETEHAKAAAAALFGGGDLHGLSPSTLSAALREAGSTSVPDAAARGGPPGGDRARQEQGRGPAHDHRGRRLPQQRAGRRSRGRAADRPT